MSRRWLKLGVLVCAVVVLLGVAVALVRGAGAGGPAPEEVAGSPPAPSDPAQRPTPSGEPSVEPGATAGPRRPTPSDPSAGATAPDRVGEPADEATGEPTDEQSEPAPTASATEVPAGTVDDVVDARPAGPTVEAEAETAELPDGITVRLVGAGLQQVEAVGPGETSGTAVVVDLELDNGTKETLGLDAVVVTLLDGADQLGSPGTGEPYAPFSGAVAPGDSTEASYVFRVTEGTQDEAFALSVTHTAGAPTVVITGTAE